MKRSIKVISITFTVITGVFLFYQILIGNPFFDEVHPSLVIAAFFIMGGAILTAMIIENNIFKKS